MYDQQHAQLVQYVQQALQSGVSIDNIRAALLGSGWHQNVIEPVLMQYQTPAKPADPHRVRNGVLWILSPFIILISVALIQLIVHLFISKSMNANNSSDVITKIISIISMLLGMVAMPMFVIGPIIGIVKLTKK